MPAIINYEEVETPSEAIMIDRLTFAMLEKLVRPATLKFVVLLMWKAR